MAQHTLRVIPLGGAGEIGRNMWVFEYGTDIIICDMGVMFPESDLLGVDLVLPDISYLRGKTAQIRGVFLTHGHEDHIGAVPWLIADLGFPPVYGTTLTLGLLQRKLKEHKLTRRVRTETITPRVPIQAGAFTIEPFHIAHSIPDAVAFGIACPAGLALYVTDWKLDHTPVDHWPTDIDQLTILGSRSPLVLVTDCVRVESPGYTPSERTVSGSFDQVFATAPGRVIMATFASNISRVQMVIDAAAAYGRKVVPIGRSMENNVAVAQELGYLHAPAGVLIRDSQMKGLPADQIAIVCTGSQGEPMAALSRMASRSHRSITIQPGDTVLVSASPIPGNEVGISKVIDQLYRLGADVIYGSDMPVHVSGHAAQEELKFLLNIVQPQYVVPSHGDYRHMMRYKQLAVGLGFKGERVLLAEAGSVMEFGPGQGGITGRTQARQVYVTGVTVGDIESMVLNDRQALGQDGIVMIVVSVEQQTGTLLAGPEILSRGFTALHEGTPVMAATKAAVRTLLTEGYTAPPRLVSDGDVAGEGNAPLVSSPLVQAIRDVVGQVLFTHTRRRPMIIPIVMDV